MINNASVINWNYWQISNRRSNNIPVGLLFTDAIYRKLLNKLGSPTASTTISILFKPILALQQHE